MTYNFLADRLAGQGYHTHASVPTLHFDFRGPRIFEEIKASNADILCLQEVDRWYDFYGARFTDLGYKYVFYKRKSRGKEEEGIVVAYKPDKFKELDRDFVDFDDLVQEYNDGLFRKDNQAMFLLLQHKQSKKRFIVGTAHTHYNPTFDYVKFAQALYGLERSVNFIQKHCKEDESNIPWIYAGDFNATPKSSVLSLFENKDVMSADVSDHWTIPADE